MPTDKHSPYALKIQADALAAQLREIVPDGRAPPSIPDALQRTLAELQDMIGMYLQKPHGYKDPFAGATCDSCGQPLKGS